MDKANDIVKIKDIQDKIFIVRGVQIMLDRDLALFYEVKAIRLREQVKRNLKRFPEDFMFRLTNAEVDFMVSQNAIPSKKHLGGSLPYAFTEQGITNLAAVLTSNRAIEINIQIVRAFVKMRNFMVTNAGIFQRIDKIEHKQLRTEQILNEILNSLEDKNIKPKQGVFYEGQIFDAYKLIADIIRSSKEKIVLIDNYIDDTVLQLFTKRKKGIKTIIYTKLISKTLKLDIDKHNAQYSKIEVKELKSSHDRFIIIDDKFVYHFGASLKDLGKKWFAFSKLEIDAKDILEKL